MPCSIPLRHGERVETLDGVGGQRYAPTASPPGKRPGAHCTAGWGSRAGLAGEENLDALINRNRFFAVIVRYVGYRTEKP